MFLLIFNLEVFMSAPVPELQLKAEVIMNAISIYLFNPIFDTNYFSSPCQDPLFFATPTTQINSLYCSALSYLYSFDVLNRNHQNDTSIYAVYPTMDTQNISEAKILSYIKGNVSNLNGQFDYEDLALAVSTGTNAVSDDKLLRDLELDMCSSGLSSLQLKQLIVTKLVGNDAPSIATSLYSIIDFPWASSTRGMIDLNDAMAVFIANNQDDALIAVNAIKQAILALSGDFTYYDIINAIINTIRANDNAELVNYFTLDFISYAMGGINGPAVYTPSQLQTALANVNGNNAAAITGSIYLALGGAWATSVTGALSLDEAVGYNHDVNNIEYPVILANIISNVTALNGTFTNNDLVQAIAVGVNSQDDRLLNNLKVDIDQASDASDLTPLQIKANIANIASVGGSKAEVVVSVYRALAWGNGTLGIHAQHLLAYAIDDYIDSGATNVTKALNEAVASLNATTAPLNDISLAIVYAIKAQSNVELINMLEISIDGLGLSVEEIQSALTNIKGSDGPSIATSIFSDLQFPYISTNQGLVRLMHDIQLYDRSDNQLVFPAAIDKLKAVAGEQYLLSILPYFNYCNKLDDVNFNVTGSVIDIPIDGNIHSVYEAIKDTALFLYNDGIAMPVLYITSSSSVGTIGNISETGCSSNIVDLDELIGLTNLLLSISFI